MNARTGRVVDLGEGDAGGIPVRSPLQGCQLLSTESWEFQLHGLHRCPADIGCGRQPSTFDRRRGDRRVFSRVHVRRRR